MKNKRFQVILCGLICLFVSTATVLTFTVLSQNNSQPFSFAINSIILNVGESKLIGYELSVTEAEVKFEIADPNIAILEGQSIRALQVGKTILRASATFQDQIVYSSCEVIVHQKEENDKPKTYTHELLIKSGATYQEDTLYVQDTACFEILIEDNYEKNIASNDLVIRQYSTGVYITKQFCAYYLSASTSGYIDFYLPEVNYEFVIHVVALQG